MRITGKEVSMCYLVSADELFLSVLEPYIRRGEALRSVKKLVDFCKLWDWEQTKNKMYTESSQHNDAFVMPPASLAKLLIYIERASEMVNDEVVQRILPMEPFSKILEVWKRKGLSAAERMYETEEIYRQTIENRRTVYDVIRRANSAMGAPLFLTNPIQTLARVYETIIDFSDLPRFEQSVDIVKYGFPFSHEGSDLFEIEMERERPGKTLDNQVDAANVGTVLGLDVLPRSGNTFYVYYTSDSHVEKVLNKQEWTHVLKPVKIELKTLSK